MSGEGGEGGGQGTAGWQRARINWGGNEMGGCKVNMELPLPLLQWRIGKVKGEQKLRMEKEEEREEKSREWVVEGQQRPQPKGKVWRVLDRKGRCSDLDKRKAGRERARVGKPRLQRKAERSTVQPR